VTDSDTRKTKGRSEFFEPGSAVFSAWHLWNISADAAQRAKELKLANPKVSTADTIVSVVLSAITTEAFVNELGYRLSALTRLTRAGNQHLQNWIDVGDLLEQLEHERVQVTSKYLLVSKLLPGEALRGDMPPYQDFAMLIKIRNDFVHAKTQTKPPLYFEQFVNRGWTYNDSGDEIRLAGWMNQLQTPQVACWACRSAHNLVWNFVARFDNIAEPAIQSIGASLRLQWGKTQDDDRIK
jgi:hypothetical protein